MAKKAQPDRHRPYWSVKLPLELKEPTERLAKKKLAAGSRMVTEAVQEYLTKHGEKWQSK